MKLSRKGRGTDLRSLSFEHWAGAQRFSSHHLHKAVSDETNSDRLLTLHESCGEVSAMNINTQIYWGTILKLSV